MFGNKQLLLVAVILGIFVFAGCNQQQHHEGGPAQQHMGAADTAAQSAAEQSDTELSGRLKDGWREVEFKAYQFGFEPEEIVVEQGDKVRLRARSTDVTHGLGLQAYDINQTLPPDEEQVIEFTADRAGEFHIHCTVYCGSGHGDMHAILRVKESREQ